MSTSLIDADTLLAIDVGNIKTRASIFDVVEGRYRYLASGEAQTTINWPFNDASEGVRQALGQLQDITGRQLVGNDEQLIIPSRVDGSGVDKLAVTLSAGPPLKIVVVGLLESVSLESARRLAKTTYARVMETISLNDRRLPEARIDTILQVRPDVVIVAGGTDGGAVQSMLKLLDSIGLACFLLPKGCRAEILFAGNQELIPEVKEGLGKLVPVHYASNLRPTLDQEQLAGPQIELSDIFRLVKSRNIPGVHQLDEWSRGNLLPSATAFSRMVKFLSKIYDPAKGVMGVNIGAGSTTVAAAFAGEASLGVYPEYGLGGNLAELLNYAQLPEISQWLHLDVSDAYLRDYLHTKALYPASLPATAEDMAVEQCIARHMLYLASRNLGRSFPAQAMRYGRNIMPLLEPILASGGVFSGAPNPAQAMMVLLDGLQPTGVTTVVLDQHHLTASLGAAAGINSVLAVQVLESNAFVNLGTVVTTFGRARFGTPVLRVRMVVGDGNETTTVVKQGSLEVLSLPQGQPARLHLTPYQRIDIGMGGPGRGGGLKVTGGVLGVIIDARGRPLQLPRDPARRRDLLQKWRWNLSC